MKEETDKLIRQLLIEFIDFINKKLKDKDKLVDEFLEYDKNDK